MANYSLHSCTAEGNALAPRIKAVQSLLRATSPQWPHLGWQSATACKQCAVNPRPAILFGVVTRRPEPRVRAILRANLHATSITAASWVLLTYDDSCHLWAREYGLGRFACDDGHLKTRGFRPKALLLQRLVRHLNGHEAVWTLDDDISLERFDLRAFWSIRSCAFRGGPPVIVQPVVRGRGQDFWPFNYDSWRSLNMTGPSSRAVNRQVALQTAFIEQQAPLFDATFFASSLMPIWQEMAALHVTTGSDQGLDLLWCGAAARSRAGRVPCAVIGVPVDHLNLKTISKKRSTFVNASRYARLYASARWPSFVVSKQIREVYQASAILIPANQRNLRCHAQQAGVELPCTPAQSRKPISTPRKTKESEGSTSRVSGAPARHAQLHLLSQIPRVIFRAWDEGPLPREFQMVWNSTREWNPTYTQVLYTPPLIKKFWRIFSQTVGSNRTHRAFRRINPHYPAAQADLFRLAVVWHYGGIWLDMKSTARFLVNHIRPDDRLVLMHEFPGWSQAWMCDGDGPHSLREAYRGEVMYRGPAKKTDCEQRFLATWNIQSSARHPCLWAAIHEAVKRIEGYKRGPRQTGWMGTVTLAGPATYTRAVYRCIKSYHGDLALGIRYLPSKFPFVYDITKEHLRLAYSGGIRNHYSRLTEPLVL